MSRICHAHCPTPHRGGWVAVLVAAAVVAALLGAAVEAVGAFNGAVDAALQWLLVGAGCVAAVAAAAALAWGVTDLVRSRRAVRAFRARHVVPVSRALASEQRVGLSAAPVYRVDAERLVETEREVA